MVRSKAASKQANIFGADNDFSPYRRRWHRQLDEQDEVHQPVLPHDRGLRLRHPKESESDRGNLVETAVRSVGVKQ